MLAIGPMGEVQHQSPKTHHSTRRPSYREAKAAVTTLSLYIEALAQTDLETARELRAARDTLSLVVSTAY